MKKWWFLSVWLAAFAPAVAADDSLTADARSRLDHIRRKTPDLAQGSALAVTHVSASLQVNDATVLGLLCENPGDGGQAVLLWSSALLREGDVLPPARILAHLVLSMDGKQDAAAHFNAADGEYRHARTLGCYLGLLQAALPGAGDAAAQRMVLTRLLHETARQAGVADVYGDPAADDARPGVRWVQTRLKPLLQADEMTDWPAALIPPENEADPAAVQAFRRGLEQGRAVH